eukprot:CAMPEP_0194266394 /NCGR_PEP_ID=MMETSP0169-20130528/1313_1 /TAXON_ID=218684 /ORGANISM="Corethron pennatum, Strain L29A3" /LENGTH=458 /DNA_ID=CAMNT_0039007065 /DNA_START=197 /DNA_END=1573 /DNA_ORIENTATION=-
MKFFTKSATVAMVAFLAVLTAALDELPSDGPPVRGRRTTEGATSSVKIEYGSEQKVREAGDQSATIVALKLQIERLTLQRNTLTRQLKTTERRLTKNQSNCPRVQSTATAAVKLSGQCPKVMCASRPTIFYFQYTGKSCASSRHSQPDKASCNDYQELSTESDVRVTFTTANGNNKRKRNNESKGNGAYFDQTVSKGVTMSIDNGGEKFPANMNIQIYKGAVLLQTVTFHSSCSNNLYTGDIFGAFKLIGFNNQDGRFICPIEKTRDPTKTPTRDPTKVPTYGPTKTPTRDPTKLPTRDPTKTPTRFPTISPTPCPRVMCESRATKFFFQYTGGSCSKSNHLQGSKASCSGNQDISTYDAAHVVFTSASSGNKKKESKNKEVYFSGWVLKGDIAIVDNGGEKFPADMEIHIYESISGSEIQTVAFHSSCSKNLFLGDVFGAMKIIGFENKEGTTKCSS